MTVRCSHRAAAARRPSIVERRGADAVDLRAHGDGASGTGRRSPARGRRCRSRSCPRRGRPPSRRFSVAPTEGKSSQRFAPRRRSGTSATTWPCSIRTVAPRSRSPGDVHVEAARADRVAAGQGDARRGRSGRRAGPARRSRRAGGVPARRGPRGRAARARRSSRCPTSTPSSGRRRAGGRSRRCSPAGAAGRPSRRRRGCSARCARTERPGASSAAAISLSAEFFAPPTYDACRPGDASGAPARPPGSSPCLVTLGAAGWSASPPPLRLAAMVNLTRIYTRTGDGGRDPARRHERDQQDRHPAARPTPTSTRPTPHLGVVLATRRARRRGRGGAHPRAERPLRRRRRPVHPGRARPGVPARCASSRTTSTGSRAGATGSTRTCPSCARSSSTAAPVAAAHLHVARTVVPPGRAVGLGRPRGVRRRR